jgi:hypothetical protein
VNDGNVENFRFKRITNPEDPGYGGIFDAYGMASAHAVTSFLKSGICALTTKESKFFNNEQLSKELLVAAGYLKKVQHEDGTIDLLSTNFHSTPDTGFIVKWLCPTYHLLEKSQVPQKEALMTALAWFLLPRSTGVQADNEPLGLRNYLGAYIPLIRDRNMLTLHGAVFTRSASWLGYLIYLGAYLHVVLSADARMIGWGYMVVGAGYFAGTLVAGNWLNAMSLRSLLATCMGVMATLMAIQLILSVGLAMSFALMVVISLAAAICIVSHNTLIQNETSAGRATTSGLSTMMFGLGGAFGGAFGGALIAAGGFAALGIGMSVLLALSVLLVGKPRSQGSVTRDPATSSAPS